MHVYPTMTIRFPEDQKDLMITEMNQRATRHWKPVPQDAYPDLGFEYIVFHHDAIAQDPPAMLFVSPIAPGELKVVNIIPEAKSRLTIDEYVRILNDFDQQIAEPAATTLGGLTSIDTATRTLDDYFSPQAIRRLECFCKTSNATNGGIHPSDQAKWIAFLLDVYRRQSYVDGDTFGALLKEKGWWPKKRIARLVDDYDFAMQLLRQNDGISEL